MTNEFETGAFQGKLAQIVNEVFAAMFSDSAEALERDEEIEVGYAASVCFVGEWTGALVVRCGIVTAENLTRQLLKRLTISPEDVPDAMGELANMIGGNLKSVLPSGVLLSVPSVALGNDLAVRIWGGNESTSSKFSSHAGPFEVTLVRMTDKNPAAIPGGSQSGPPANRRAC
jgi:chemotaxis protein CheX